MNERPNLAVLIVMLLAVSACKGRDAAKTEEPRSRLEALMDGAPSQPPCSTKVSQELGLSWPVPVLLDGKLRYRAFFHGYSGPGPKASNRDAEGDLLIAPEGRVLECSERAGPRAKVLPKTAPTGMSVEEALARRRRLYASIERVGDLYASKAGPDATQRDELKGFKAEFAAMSDPGHEASYRALNPDFWAWLDKNAAP